MQFSRPPTPVVPPLSCNIFVLDFSTNPWANQTMDQSALYLRPKSSIMPVQLHLSNSPFAQQQNPTQFNVQHETQLPISHPLNHAPQTF